MFLLCKTLCVTLEWKGLYKYINLNLNLNETSRFCCFTETFSSWLSNCQRIVKWIYSGDYYPTTAMNSWILSVLCYCITYLLGNMVDQITVLKHRGPCRSPAAKFCLTTQNILCFFDHKQQSAVHITAYNPKTTNLLLRWNYYFYFFSIHR